MTALTRVTARWLLTVCILLFASPSVWAEMRCEICRGQVFNTVYIVKDAVALTSKEVCYFCAHDAPSCFLCSLPVVTNAPGPVLLSDGRVLCTRDGATAVVESKAGANAAQDVREWMQREFGRFLQVPETNCTIDLVDRPTLETLFKFPGRDRTCPDIWGTAQALTNNGAVTYELSLLAGLPLAMLRHTAAHELAHAWIFENVPVARREQMDQNSQEGFCELLAWLLDETCTDKTLKAYMRRNGYTRGQIDLFLEAHRRFGLNDILDWLKYGTTRRLVASDLAQIRNVEMPGNSASAALKPKPAFVPLPAPPVPVYSAITLQGVFWNAKAPTAMINGKSFGVNETALVKLNGTNLTVRCLAIEPTRVRISAAGTEQDLYLPE